MVVVCLKNGWRGKEAGRAAVIGCLSDLKGPILIRIVFLYAFAKNARASISEKEKKALSLVAEAFVSATDAQVSLLLQEGSIVEVKHYE